MLFWKQLRLGKKSIILSVYLKPVSWGEYVVLLKPHLACAAKAITRPWLGLCLLSVPEAFVA